MISNEKYLSKWKIQLKCYIHNIKKGSVIPQPATLNNIPASKMVLFKKVNLYFSGGSRIWP